MQTSLKEAAFLKMKAFFIKISGLVMRSGMKLEMKYLRKVVGIVLLIAIAFALQWGHRLIAFFFVVMLLLLVNRNEQHVMAHASAIQDVFHRKTRILNKRIYPIKPLLALRQITLGEMIGNMRSDYYHIIYVSDEVCRILGFLTEQEILSSVVQYHSGMSLGELLAVKKKLSEDGSGTENDCENCETFPLKPG